MDLNYISNGMCWIIILELDQSENNFRETAKEWIECEQFFSGTLFGRKKNTETHQIIFSLLEGRKRGQTQFTENNHKNWKFCWNHYYFIFVYPCYKYSVFWILKGYFPMVYDIEKCTKFDAGGGGAFLTNNSGPM